MAVQSIQCTQCRAPLRATQGAVTCEYCGAANQIGAPVPSTTMVRGVVHDVLREDRNGNGIPDALERGRHLPVHPSQFLTPAQIAARTAAAQRTAKVIVGIIALTMIAGAAGVFFMVRNTVSSARIEPVYSAPPQPVAVTPAPAVADDIFAGELHSLAFDGSGHVFFALGTTLVRAKTATLEIEWTQPIVKLGFHIDYTVLVLSERIAVGTDNAVSFYSIVDGKPSGSYVLANRGFNHFCSVDNTLVVTAQGTATLRIDALTAQKSATKVNCVAERDMRCEKGEACTWRPRQFKDHKCYLNLRVGDRDYVPCDTDNGTGDKELVALDPKGRVIWTSKLEGGSRPDYMTKIDNAVIVHHSTNVEAFNATDGAQLWHKTVKGAVATSPDRSRLLVGDGTTMVALRPADGSEIGRLGPLPAANP